MLKRIVKMQEKILRVIKRSGKALGRTEIAKILNERPEKITNRITQMVKSNQLGCIEIDRHEAKKRFNAKRRMRLYYVLED